MQDMIRRKIDFGTHKEARSRLRNHEYVSHIFVCNKRKCRDLTKEMWKICPSLSGNKSGLVGIYED